MLKSTERNAGSFFIIATVFFLIGGVLTTALPAVIETNWNKPSQGMRPYSESEARGKAIYVRDGLFKDIDITLFSHVSSDMRAAWGTQSSNALVSVRYDFTGAAAAVAGHFVDGREWK